MLGFGWDNGTEEIVGRMGLGGYSTLEAGLGLQFDNGAADATVAQEDLRSTLSLSVRYLHALHAWDKFTGYLHAGLYFRDDQGAGTNSADPIRGIGGSGNGRAAGLAVFLGYEPELVLLQHLSVSTKFGATVPVMPEFKLGLVGNGVSIVEGFNFRILF
jgi:hypothetical protein